MTLNYSNKSLNEPKSLTELSNNTTSFKKIKYGIMIIGLNVVLLFLIIFAYFLYSFTSPNQLIDDRKLIKKRRINKSKKNTKYNHLKSRSYSFDI